jgi:hypothetical protein
MDDLPLPCPEDRILFYSRRRGRSRWCDERHGGAPEKSLGSKGFFFSLFYLPVPFVRISPI